MGIAEVTALDGRSILLLFEAVGTGRTGWGLGRGQRPTEHESRRRGGGGVRSGTAYGCDVTGGIGGGGRGGDVNVDGAVRRSEGGREGVAMLTGTPVTALPRGDGVRTAVQPHLSPEDRSGHAVYGAARYTRLVGQLSYTGPRGISTHAVGQL